MRHYGDWPQIPRPLVSEAHTPLQGSLCCGAFLSPSEAAGQWLWAAGRGSLPGPVASVGWEPSFSED